MQPLVTVPDRQPELGHWLQRTFVVGRGFLHPDARTATRSYTVRYDLGRVLALDQAFLSEDGPRLGPTSDRPPPRAGDADGRPRGAVGPQRSSEGIALARFPGTPGPRRRPMLRAAAARPG